MRKIINLGKSLKIKSPENAVQDRYTDKLELWESTKKDIQELTKKIIIDGNKHFPTHIVLKDDKLITAFKLDKLDLNGFSYFRPRFSCKLIKQTFDEMKKMIADRGLDDFVFRKEGSKKALFDDDFLFDMSFYLSSLLYLNAEESFLVKDCDIILEITQENKEEVRKIIKKKVIRNS